VASASNPITNYQFFSVKKKQHSANILMVVSPSGRILYLSPPWGSATLDLTIARVTKEHWYEKLANWEWGLGDLGFEGLCADGCRVLPPPERRTPFYKHHARARIIVEQKFADIKDWRAAKDPLRMSMADKETLLKTHHKIWTDSGFGK
jgi:hypothetical protein